MAYEDFDHSLCMDRKLIRVEGRDFEISTSITLQHTKWFGTLFSNKFKEGNQDGPVELKTEGLGIDAEGFLSFLRCIYDSEYRIDGNNYMKILQVAHFVDAARIIKNVESFIIANCSHAHWQATENNKDHPFSVDLLAAIELSFAYDLKKLQSHCEKQLLRMRFHTFLKNYNACTDLDEKAQAYIFGVYAKSIMTAQAKKNQP